jgi:hypothetical protein
MLYMAIQLPSSEQRYREPVATKAASQFGLSKPPSKPTKPGALLVAPRRYL